MKNQNNLVIDEGKLKLFELFAVRAIEKFYANPENQRKFEEWKKNKEKALRG